MSFANLIDTDIKVLTNLTEHDEKFDKNYDEFITKIETAADSSDGVSLKHESLIDDDVFVLDNNDSIPNNQKVFFIYKFCKIIVRCIRIFF